MDMTHWPNSIKCPRCGKSQLWPPRPLFGTWQCSQCHSVLGTDVWRHIVGIAVWGIVAYLIVTCTGWPSWAKALSVALGYVPVFLWFESAVLKGDPVSFQGSASADSHSAPLS